MKVVHRQKAAGSVSELTSKAKELEASGNSEEAAEIYQSIIRADPLNELPYNRLMVIYRKQKAYKEELSIIKAGIKAFADFYKSRKPKTAIGNSKISKLSKSILKSTGLLTDEGKPVYQEEPIQKWEKRKRVVEGKI